MREKEEGDDGREEARGEGRFREVVGDDAR